MATPYGGEPARGAAPSVVGVGVEAADDAGLGPGDGLRLFWYAGDSPPADTDETDDGDVGSGGFCMSSSPGPDSGPDRGPSEDDDEDTLVKAERAWSSWRPWPITIRLGGCCCRIRCCWCSVACGGVIATFNGVIADLIMRDAVVTRRSCCSCSWWRFLMVLRSSGAIRKATSKLLLIDILLLVWCGGGGDLLLLLLLLWRMGRDGDEAGLRPGDPVRPDEAEASEDAGDDVEVLVLAASEAASTRRPPRCCTCMSMVILEQNKQSAGP